MKVNLYPREDGNWQADAYLPDGRDFHAVGSEPGRALIELGMFWLSQPKSNDLHTLATVLLEAPK